MGFKAPPSKLIQFPEELKQHPLPRPYVLKPCYSRAAHQVITVAANDPLPNPTITSYNPWVAQKWLHGKKFCSHSIAHKGKLTAHVAYPVDFSINGSSCLNFEAIDHPAIFNWVKKFAEQEKFTGQIAFDFIQSMDNTLYAIECNPRGTSGLHLYRPKDRLPKAFFNTDSALIQPKPGHKRQIGLAMATYGWKMISYNKKWRTFFRKLLTTHDVIFCVRDVKPSLYLPLLFLIYIWKCIKLKRSMSAMFTFDMDWNGEEFEKKRQSPNKKQTSLEK